MAYGSDTMRDCTRDSAVMRTLAKVRRRVSESNDTSVMPSVSHSFLVSFHQPT